MDPFSPDVVRDYEPIHPKGTDWRGLLRKIWAPIAAVIGIAIKFGVAFAKFASIFVAVGGYALIWGWKFAVGLVFLLLVHEMGHYIEARRQVRDRVREVRVDLRGRRRLRADLGLEVRNRARLSPPGA